MSLLYLIISYVILHHQSLKFYQKKIFDSPKSVTKYSNNYSLTHIISDTFTYSLYLMKDFIQKKLRNTLT